MEAHLILPKVIREIGNHDLGLGRNAVLRRATLLARKTRLTGLVVRGACLASRLDWLAKAG